MNAFSLSHTSTQQYKGPGVILSLPIREASGSPFPSQEEEGVCIHCFGSGMECGYCGWNIDYEDGSMDTLFNEAMESDRMPGYTLPAWGV